MLEPAHVGAAHRTAGVQAASTWLDRWRALRDRLLASPAFQRWAAAFPLTRPIARRRARALFDLCAGFVYSQVLLACVRLRLFDILAEGPQTVAALSVRLSLSQEATMRLLCAAVSLRLAERRGDDRFGLGDLGAALLGNPGIAAMVEHHALLYADLEDPVALLRGERPDTELARYWAYARADRPAALDGERVAAYSRAHVRVAAPRRRRSARRLSAGRASLPARCRGRGRSLSRGRRDARATASPDALRSARGGGACRGATGGRPGSRTACAWRAATSSRIRCPQAQTSSRWSGWSTTTTTLRRSRLLRAVRRALPADGTLLLAEPMSGTPGAEPIGDAYFGFYLLAMGSGRPRTPDELETLLQRAGFGHIRRVPTRMPLQVCLMVARAVGASVNYA